MRDVFGGAFMIRLWIVFIVIYVSFTAVALNYAKAFKAKNAVIEYLEDHEISNLNDISAQAESEMIDYFDSEIVGNLNYKHELNIGIKIERVLPSGSTNKLGVYYRVTTYFGYDITFLNIISGLSGNGREGKINSLWKIVGETRPIAYE